MNFRVRTDEEVGQNTFRKRSVASPSPCDIALKCCACEPNHLLSKVPVHGGIRLSEKPVQLCHASPGRSE